MHHYVTTMLNLLKSPGRKKEHEEQNLILTDVTYEVEIQSTVLHISHKGKKNLNHKEPNFPAFKGYRN